MLLFTCSFVKILSVVVLLSCETHSCAIETQNDSSSDEPPSDGLIQTDPVFLFQGDARNITSESQNESSDSPVSGQANKDQMDIDTSTVDVIFRKRSDEDVDDSTNGTTEPEGKTERCDADNQNTEAATVGHLDAFIDVLFKTRNEDGSINEEASSGTADENAESDVNNESQSQNDQVQLAGQSDAEQLGDLSLIDILFKKRSEDEADDGGETLDVDDTTSGANDSESKVEVEEVELVEVTSPESPLAPSAVVSFDDYFPRSQPESDLDGEQPAEVKPMTDYLIPPLFK